MTHFRGMPDEANAHIAELAQLVARGTHNPKVAGSNPALGTFLALATQHREFSPRVHGSSGPRV